jgi:hypothetical protein
MTYNGETAVADSFGLNILPISSAKLSFCKLGFHLPLDFQIQIVRENTFIDLGQVGMAVFNRSPHLSHIRIIKILSFINKLFIFRELNKSCNSFNIPFLPLYIFAFVDVLAY